MKNLFKLLGVVLIATFFLVTVSCNDEDNEIIKKGGTIEVTNGLTDSAVMSSTVIIVEGIDGTQAYNDISQGRGTQILKGETKTFTYDKDGAYTVVALPPVKAALPPCFTQLVYLALGGVQKVTITD